MVTENEMPHGFVDTIRAVNLWVDVVSDEMDRMLDAEDMALVRALALNIMDRWRHLASTSDDFKRIYVEHKQSAQAYIVAVVEATRRLGKLQKLDNWSKA